MTQSDEPDAETGDEAEATAESPAASTEAGAAPAVPSPSPFAGLPTNPRSVVGTALDVVTHSSRELRAASFYVGLLVLGLSTPFAFLAWRFEIDPALFLPADVEGPWYVALVIAFAGLIVATIESRAVAAVLLAARLGGRAIALHEAVQRSRTVFWRIVGVLILANLPLVLVQGWLDERVAEAFGGNPDAAGVLVAAALAVAFSPLAYVVTGVVLGDVGPWTAVRRSIRLFRARKPTAVVVAVFDVAAQLLTVVGLVAALDLVVRAAEASGLSPTEPLGAAATVALIVILLFAVGTLLLTVAAISIAPQVVAFVALTHASPGLDRLGGGDRTFRWLTRPMLATMGVGAVAMFGGLSAFG